MGRSKFEQTVYHVCVINSEQTGYRLSSQKRHKNMFRLQHNAKGQYHTLSYNVVRLIVTLGAAHCMDTCTHY